MIFTFNIYQTLALSVVALQIGLYIRKKVSFFERFCIPAPVIGGLLFAIISCILYVTGVAEFAFDETMRDLCMVFFFTCVGFHADMKTLKSGGKALVLYSLCIGAMIVAAVLRNISEYTGKFRIRTGEINAMSGIFLNLFLGIAMLTLKLWQLAELALPLIILLAVQTIFILFYEKLDIPYPGKLVLQSPGLQVPPSESQKAGMEKRAKVDVMIPPGFFDEIAPVLATGDEAYLLSPILFDMTGFPPIDIFYGTREVMIAYLKDMEAACAKYHVPLHVHIGRGMMHCWGAMEFVPEAQAVRQEYYEALR